MKKTIVIGILGPTLDRGWNAGRWEHWRPSVAICQHSDLLIDRFELLYQRNYTKLMERIRDDIQSVSPETTVVAHETNFKDPWDFEEVYGVLHDFSRAYPFDRENEEYLIHITTGSHVAQICLYLLNESNYLPGRLLQASPSSKRHKQDVAGEYRIIDLDLSRYDQIAMRFKQEIKDDIFFLKSGIETQNSLFNRLIEQIERVAVNCIDPVLITGPTGAGKSRLARRIYELKKARHQISGRFVEVNCATLRGDGAMSALFGHKKGAFTGAAQDRAGLLKSADKGLLFLDEVGELGLDEQSMLLRAVEEKTFLPVGADMEAESGFQLICGTNRDLFKAVVQKEFREDLLARINLWTFEIPGLNKRPEDIEPNLNYELDRFAEFNNTRITFNKEARALFLEFAIGPNALWPANFRDLNGAVKRMATLAPGGRITSRVVEDEINTLQTRWAGFADTCKTGTPQDDLLVEVLGKEQADSLDRFEKVQLSDVLTVCKESQTIARAGRVLFASSRQKKTRVNDSDRLRKYLAKYRIQWKDL